jgi:hypothetical protein
MKKFKITFDYIPSFDNEKGLDELSTPKFLFGVLVILKFKVPPFKISL